MTPVGPLLQGFFGERMMRQRQASPHTIAAYRDTFRLLFRFAEARLKKAPSALALSDLDATFIGSFLDHLETERANGPRTRNARLAAIHSFFHFAELRVPEHAGLIRQVLAIPQKRYQRNVVDYLTQPEVDAMLAAPDRSTWFGRRDHALLLLAEQTGLRVSELVNLRLEDVKLGDHPVVHCLGKGRKIRDTPLGKRTVAALRVWLEERAGMPGTALFPSCRGLALTRDAVERIVKKYCALARKRCPTLEKKRVSPHVLRHTTAVRLVQAGIDAATVALWLGHESVDTTRIYIEADMTIKERALGRVARRSPSRAGSAPATSSWPSSKASDYADALERTIEHGRGLHGAGTTKFGIIRGSA